MPPAAEFFVATVDEEPVAHLAVAPMFTAYAYRATRLVVMPEWQGAGVGTKFLEWVCQYHLEGNGRRGHKYGVLFHTSHPQLCAYLRRSPLWIQKSQQLFGGNKAKSARSIGIANARRKDEWKLKETEKKPGIGPVKSGGYGGHFRAVQGFKYLGIREPK